MSPDRSAPSAVAARWKICTPRVVSSLLRKAATRVTVSLRGPVRGAVGAPAGSGALPPTVAGPGSPPGTGVLGQRRRREGFAVRRQVATARGLLVAWLLGLRRRGRRGLGRWGTVPVGTETAGLVAAADCEAAPTGPSAAGRTAPARPAPDTESCPHRTGGAVAKSVARRRPRRRPSAHPAPTDGDRRRSDRGLGAAPPHPAPPRRTGGHSHSGPGAPPGAAACGIMIAVSSPTAAADPSEVVIDVVVTASPTLSDEVIRLARAAAVVESGDGNGRR